MYSDGVAYVVQQVMFFFFFFFFSAVEAAAARTINPRRARTGGECSSSGGRAMAQPEHAEQASPAAGAAAMHCTPSMPERIPAPPAAPRQTLRGTLLESLQEETERQADAQRALQASVSHGRPRRLNSSEFTSQRTAQEPGTRLFMAEDAPPPADNARSAPVVDKRPAPSLQLQRAQFRHC